MGLSALVIVVMEGCSVATSSLKAWRDLIKSRPPVIGRRPRLSAIHDLYSASSPQPMCNVCIRIVVARWLGN